jgi:hypothetical protein
MSASEIAVASKAGIKFLPVRTCILNWSSVSLLSNRFGTTEMAEAPNAL